MLFKGNTKRNCLNECFDTNCTTSACIQDCHKRCRTRLTFTKTVETTYDCDHADCKSNGNGALIPNITTNIHIQNIMPNITNCTSDNTKISSIAGNDKSGGSSRVTEMNRDKENYTIPKIDIHNEINNHFEYPQSGRDCPCCEYQLSLK